MTYFGAKVTSTANTILAPRPSVSRVYLLTNTEIKFDSHITGFEIFAITNGTITIEVL